MAKPKKQTDYLSALIGSNQDEPEGMLSALPVTGNADIDDAVESSFIVNHLEQAQSNVEKVMGAGYCIRLIFVTADQAAEFLRHVQWPAIGNPDHKCIDGLAVAEHLGVPLTPEQIPFRGRRTEKRIAGTGVIPDYPAQEDVT